MEKKDPWSPRIFWLTLIGFVATIVATSAFNKGVVDVSPLKSIYTVSEPDSEEEGNSRNIGVKVKKAFLSPVHLSIPAYFFIEFTGASFDEKPENFKILFDFGIASVEECGVSPKSQVSWIGGSDPSFRTLQVSTIENSQSVYVACLISVPIFPKVLVTGGNLTYQTKFNSKKSDDEGEWFWPFLGKSIVVAIVLGVFSLLLFEWFCYIVGNWHRLVKTRKP